MEIGALVVVSCSGPREKFWGVLLALAPVGATLRGISVAAFDEWVRDCAGGGPRLLGPVTMFIPAHRLERIELDERAGVVESLAERFSRETGADAAAVLAGRLPEATQ